jgi:glycosyltransferase involved in cell wall biosynthesis
MKILCVIDSLGSGGAQRQLVSLAVGFNEEEHEVSFLVYHREIFYYQTLKEKNITVNEIIETNYLKRLFKMRRFIRSGGFDFVLSFLTSANFICENAGLPWRNWKLVVGERSANPNILKSYKQCAFRYFHLLADAIVANSHENIKIVRKINPLLSNKKCHVIYNMVDFEKWKPSSENYEFRKNGKFNLIVIASHQYLKNLNGLVEAVALLNEHEKKLLQINWYGGPGLDDSREAALQKIEKNGLEQIFNFHGPTVNIHIELNKADALGLFSFYEGLPNVICEAMAMGKTVIASSVSDIPLLISNSNLLVSPTKPDSICNSIRYLLQLNEGELFDEGYKNKTLALKKFRKEKIVKNYLELLK